MPCASWRRRCACRSNTRCASAAAFRRCGDVPAAIPTTSASGLTSSSPAPRAGTHFGLGRSPGGDTASSRRSVSFLVKMDTVPTRSQTARWLPARYPIHRLAQAIAFTLSTCRAWTCSARSMTRYPGMGFYNLNPEAIRDLQAPDPGELLKRDGSNLASVLSNLQSGRKTAVEEYLTAITPGVTGVAARTMGTKLTLDFRQEVRGASTRGGSRRATCPMGHCAHSASSSPCFRAMANRTNDATWSASKSRKALFIPLPPASSSTA